MRFEGDAGSDRYHKRGDIDHKSSLQRSAFGAQTRGRRGDVGHMPSRVELTTIEALSSSAIAERRKCAVERHFHRETVGVFEKATQIVNSFA